MKRVFLKAKLHRAVVTSVEIDYEGSCAIDENLMIAADILEYEMLHIYNINNGKRFTTYAIKSTANSGIISFNGAAAHKADIGDKVIICTYAEYKKSAYKKYKPKLVYLDDLNHITHTKHKIYPQIS
ncbi:MAG: aspartate 1-decarboxylase [Gammaproteobacteria bacterium]|nr:MAG: aspartate 1-decarboxylase [Gammaproteobacteria bacterium]